MSFEPRIGPHGRDDDLTRALRRLYAAPVDEGYWSALLGQIMARIGEEDGWWQPLAPWARIGVLAAGIGLAVASLALTRSRETAARIAYEAILETPRSAPLQIATDRGEDSGREATLRYVISP